MSEPYIGEVRMFGGSFAPVGWLKCDGQLVPISTYDTLYVLLGTTYGGDGTTTFGIPDLRGRSPLHAGTGQGLSPRVLGQTFGSETVALTAAQMPVHSHLVKANATTGTLGSPITAVWAQNSTADLDYSTGAPATTMSPGATTPSGKGVPHDNMAPFQAVTFIICYAGIFPPQS